MKDLKLVAAFAHAALLIAAFRDVLVLLQASSWRDISIVAKWSIKVAKADASPI